MKGQQENVIVLTRWLQIEMVKLISTLDSNVKPDIWRRWPNQINEYIMMNRAEVVYTYHKHGTRGLNLRIEHLITYKKMDNTIFLSSDIQTQRALAITKNLKKSWRKRKWSCPFSHKTDEAAHVLDYGEKYQTCRRSIQIV